MSEIVREIQAFEQLLHDVNAQYATLKNKSESIAGRHWERRQRHSVWMMDFWHEADGAGVKEEQLVREQQKHIRVDAKIVKLYLKFLNLQTSKIQNFLSKLKYLKKISSTPLAELTVHSYKEWVCTNPEIQAIQSEILDLFEQKIRSSKVISKEVDLVWKKEAPRELNFERLRTQTYLFVERDPFIDAEFAYVIRQALNVESNTFESVKLKEFIRHSWQGSYRREMLGDYYQDFVNVMAEHLITKFGYLKHCSRKEMTRDQVLGIFEAQLLPHILYKCITCQDDDNILSTQLKKLSTLSQKALGVGQKYIDNALFPYDDAIVKLQCVEVARLPLQKIRFIILAAQAVMNRMIELNPGENIGADEFMDVLVYVTIRARPTHLFAHLHYLKHFANPSYMLSETGYYLSSLELAAEYIKCMQLPDHNKVRDILLVDCDQLVERKSMKKLFQKIDNQFVLPGYETCVIPKWFAKSNRLTCTVLQPCAGSRSYVSRWRLTNDRITINQLFCNDATTLTKAGGYYAVALKENYSAKEIVIPLGDLRYHECRHWFVMHNNLRRFGVPSCRQYVATFAEMQFECKQMLNAFQQSFQDHQMDTVVKNAIRCLEQLYSPIKVLSRDVLNDQCVQMVCKFQQEQLACADLRTDGVCDRQVYDLLLKSVSCS